MEEKIGTRINLNRVDEAISTGVDEVAVACPFCSVMLNDAVTVRGQEAGGDAAAEVVDVATLLLDRVKQK
jgi:Fe-S oxidoreductase